MFDLHTYLLINFMFLAGVVDNLTTCPRLISEVESVLAGGEWPPATDEAPYLQRRWANLALEKDKMTLISLTK